MDGRTFASKKEMRRYAQLKLLERAGEIENLELQPRFVLIPKPNKISYYADFKYTENGKEVIEDVKGYETQIFKLKHKMFKHFYPEKELRIVKKV